MKLRFRLPYILIIFILNLCSLFSYAGSASLQKEGVRFLMVYETNKPLNLHKSILYFSHYKWFEKKQDSLVINYPDNFGTPDSISYDTVLQHPVYLMLKLYYTGRTLKSNTFYFSSGKLFYDAAVGDTLLTIRPKMAGDNFSSQSSLKGSVLVILAILEMIVALMISRVFGLSRHIILMVMVANIAAFPLYMIGISGFYWREVLVLLVKTLVMILIGLRKMPIYQILIVLGVLTIFGLGVKELLFFVAHIL